MKIIGVGRNYVEHAKELGNEVPSEPVLFLMPDSAILRKNDAFYYPSFSEDVHHELELVVKICRVGKNIQQKFAYKYYEEIGLGIDFTARDLQSQAKKKGLPWSIAKGFNGSLPISFFRPKQDFDLDNIDLVLKKNGETVQHGNTKDMLFSIDQIIEYCSKFFTLKKGDLIYTGTPSGVGPVQIGDRLEGFLNDEKLLDFEVR